MHFFCHTYQKPFITYIPHFELSRGAAGFSTCNLKKSKENLVAGLIKGGSSVTFSDSEDEKIIT